MNKIRKTKPKFIIPKPGAQAAKTLTQLELSKKEISLYSLKKAALRIHKQKLETMAPKEVELKQKMRKQDLSNLNNFILQNTIYPHEKPISRGFLSHDDKYFATTSWSGLCKVWTADSNPKLVTTLKGHAFEVFDLDFHPQFGEIGPNQPNIMTCGADSTIRLWTFNKDKEEQPHLELLEHQERVNKAKFHPSGLYAVSASYDKSLALWDIEKEKVISRLKGHKSSIYAMSLHPDGSLVYSGDLEAIGMLWDLRTSVPILSLAGHHSKILGSDFSSDGYHMATCSGDNTTKIWDLRRKKAMVTLPSHEKLISDVRYQKGPNSHFLMTCSYDGTAKFHSTSDFKELLSIKLAQTRLTSVSITKNLKSLFLTSVEKKVYCYQRQTIDDLAKDEVVGAMTSMVPDTDQNMLFGDTDFLSKLLSSTQSSNKIYPKNLNFSYLIELVVSWRPSKPILLVNPRIQ